MPDIGKVLKEEIARISKREANNLLTPHIKTIRALKREVAALKKQMGKPSVKLPAEPKAILADQPEGKNVWFTSKGVKGMRKRLGVNRSQMAKLCGVTPSAVGLWEDVKTGKLNLHAKTRDALIELRQMSPTAAKKALSGE
ncbi:MAG: hypothetical protein ACNA71_06100 [Kiritimatiellia bacterium]